MKRPQSVRRLVEAKIMLACVLVVLGVTSAFAQQNITPPSHQDILPLSGGQTIDIDTVQDASPSITNYPDLSLTPGRPEIVNLDTDAANIIVGNTDNIAVVPESSRRLVIIPRSNGATFLKILDADGNSIMERHVIVGAVKAEQNYVRIRRSCINGGRDCVEASTYYCPGMCHQVSSQGSDNFALPDETSSGNRGYQLRNNGQGTARPVNSSVEVGNELGNNADLPIELITEE